VGVACVLFYSLPVEASITAIFRGLEVCCCSEVYIVSSARRSESVKELCRVLRGVVRGVEFKALPIIPDVEDRPEEVGRVVSALRRLLGRLRACFIASAGSRLEVASTSMALDRGLTDVIYVSFLWGPWTGAYYPFTPRPIQLVHVLHPGIEVFRECRGGLDLRGVGEVLLGEDVPPLRREVLIAQLLINSELGDRCVMYEGSGFSCGGVRVSARFRGRDVVVSEVGDYCSWDEVVRLTEEVSSNVEELGVGGMRDRDVKLYEALTTMVNVSGFRLPVVKECIDGCGGLEGYALVDFLEGVGEELLIDTSLMYQGLHNYLHSARRGALLNVAIPLSTYVEMYEHRVHVPRNLYGEVRAELSRLLLEEVKYFKPKVVREVVVRPSEVGIALSKLGIAVTSDRKGFNNLYRLLFRRSVLTELRPVSDVKFKVSERSRRASYAYYAIAQLKALSKLLGRVLSRRGLSISVTLTGGKR